MKENKNKINLFKIPELDNKIGVLDNKIDVLDDKIGV
jgi:hypothetical protein